MKIKGHLYLTNYISQFSSTNRNMLLLKFFLLVSVLTLVYCGPINCNSGNSYMGSLLDVETLQDDPCEDKDVCRFDCSTLPGLSSCTKTAYFADFTKYATGTAAQISTTYIDVCIKRVTPGENNFFVGILQKYAMIRSKQEMVENTRWKDLNSRLNQYFNSGNVVYYYIASMVEVLLGFQKLCSQSSSKINFKIKKKIGKI
jgi:hypothetical protein